MTRITNDCHIYPTLCHQTGLRGASAGRKCRASCNHWEGETPGDCLCMAKGALWCHMLFCGADLTLLEWGQGYCLWSPGWLYMAIVHVDLCCSLWSWTFVARAYGGGPRQEVQHSGTYLVASTCWPCYYTQAWWSYLFEGLQCHRLPRFRHSAI